MRVLVFGGRGQLGRELVATAPSEHDLFAATRGDVDLTDFRSITTAVAEYRPDLMINAAAYTAVDHAEGEAELAFAVNAGAPAVMAEAAVNMGARLVHVSTDYVFDGMRDVPYATSAPVSPINVYGKSKAEGELRVLDIAPRNAAVVRTSWLYSSHGRNFVLTMLKAMREDSQVRVVADQTGSPTWARTLAQAIWSGAFHGTLTGIAHWTDAGTATWHGFAEEIARGAADRGLLRNPVEIQPISTSALQATAERPRYSVLDLSEAGRLFGAEPVPWRQALGMMLDEMNAA